MPKKRESYIQIEILFLTHKKKKKESWHNSCTAFPSCVNLQVTISAQFILCIQWDVLVFELRVEMKCNKKAPLNASFMIQYLHLTSQTKMFTVFEDIIFTHSIKIMHFNYVRIQSITSTPTSTKQPYYTVISHPLTFSI